jgi:Niemann-Pick C1 protein
MFFFVGLLFIGINYSAQLDMGMEPSEALPKDSYLVTYYNELHEYSESGEPLFVVIREGFDYSSVESQNTICTLPSCNSDSLLNSFVNAEYVQGPVYSWLDDYLNYGNAHGND